MKRTRKSLRLCLLLSLFAGALAGCATTQQAEGTATLDAGGGSTLSTDEAVALAPGIVDEIENQAGEDPQVVAMDKEVDLKKANLLLWKLEKRKIDRAVQAYWGDGSEGESDDETYRRHLLDMERLAVIDRYQEIEPPLIARMGEERDMLFARKKESLLADRRAAPSMAEPSAMPSAMPSAAADVPLETGGEMGMGLVPEGSAAPESPGEEIGRAGDIEQPSVKAKTRSAFNEAYLEYRDKRPKIEPVAFDPMILGLIPQIGMEKVGEINRCAKYLCVLYKASALFADMFFQNAELEQYKSRKEAEWKRMVASGRFQNASVNEVEGAFQTFMAETRRDAEYQSILNQMIASRKDFVKRSKELGKDALVEMIKRYIDPKAIMEAKPQSGMNLFQKGKFVLKLKDEALKVKTLLKQAGYIGMGTTLITGKFASTIVIATLEVGGVVVTVAADVTGRVIISAVDASGKAVALVVQGGVYVVKGTGKVVLTSARLAEDLGRGVGAQIGNMMAGSLSEKGLFDVALLDQPPAEVDHANG